MSKGCRAALAERRKKVCQGPHNTRKPRHWNDPRRLFLMGERYHPAAFEVVFIGNLISLLFVLKSHVDQINVQLDDDLGLGPSISAMIPKIVLQIKWQRGRKRILSDNFARIEKIVRGRKFPIALQPGCDKATVVIDCCFDGVPSISADVLRCRNFDELDASTDSRSGVPES